MSGSPIIQDGKIIGAVTHVFVNDPTEGLWDPDRRYDEIRVMKKIEKRY